MEKEKIVLIGTSGHAKVILDIVEKQGVYEIAGFIDSFKQIGEEVLGYQVLGREEDIPYLIKKFGIIGGIIAIGDNWTRYNVCQKIKGVVQEFIFVKAIHPNAQIAKAVKVGSGTVVMAGAIINSNSIIGEHCIINTNSSLDHDSVMGDYSSLAPGVSTGGNVKIGEFSAVNLGANVIHGIIIGEHSVVGAGALVLKNVPKNSVVYGLPAKFVRLREIGEKYL